MDKNQNQSQDLIKYINKALQEKEKENRYSTIPLAKSMLEITLIHIGDLYNSIGLNEDPGSEQTSHLGEAIQWYKRAYENNHHNPVILQKLSDCYQTRGQIRREHNMPGFKEDLEESKEYQKKYKELIEKS